MPFSPVYSSAFIEYTAETPNSSFAVPEGFTAVIRQLSLYQEIGGWVGECYIQNSEEAPGVVIWAGSAVGAVGYLATEGRWVCPGGGVITIAVSELGTSPSFYCGGYLLTNTEA